MDTSHWKEQYEKFAKAEQASRDGKPRIMSWDAPKPKLSDLINCATLARGTPDIWDLVVSESKKSPEQRDKEEDYALTEICGLFTRWFQYMTNSREFNTIAYASIQNILLAWARAGVEDVEIARGIINGEFYDDDLPRSASGSADQ